MISQLLKAEVYK